MTHVGCACAASRAACNTDPPRSTPTRTLGVVKVLSSSYVLRLVTAHTSHNLTAQSHARARRAPTRPTSHGACAAMQRNSPMSVYCRNVLSP